MWQGSSKTLLTVISAILESPNNCLNPAIPLKLPLSLANFSRKLLLFAKALTSSTLSVFRLTYLWLILVTCILWGHQLC